MKRFLRILMTRERNKEINADGLLAPRAQEVLNAVIARSLSAKIQESYSVVLHSLRLRLRFSFIRAIGYVLRAPRRHYRGKGRSPVFINHGLSDNSALNHVDWLFKYVALAFVL